MITRSLARWCLAMLGAVPVVSWTAMSGAAAASPTQPVAVRWQAPEGCPAEPEVEAQIRSALSHVEGHGAVDVRAEVTVPTSGVGFTLRVRVLHEGQIGERTLPIDDCNDASRAAALLVALSVGTPPAPVARPALPPDPAPVPSQPPHWSFGAGPRLAVGMGPELSAGVGLSAAYGRSFWRLSLRGAAFAKSHHSIPDKPWGGVFRLFTGGLFACAGYPGALSLYGCLGGRVDHLTGEATGASASFERSTQVGSLAAGATLEWTVTRRFRLRAELEAGYPLADARFTIQNEATPVHVVDGLRGEAALELAVFF